MISARPQGPGRRRGITLTEILISIMILGIGLISLATLFPIGLLRLREAQRQSRSAYLAESAAADVAARGLLKTDSFTYADYPQHLLSRPYCTSPAGTSPPPTGSLLQPADPGHAGLRRWTRTSRPPPTSRRASTRLGVRRLRPALRLRSALAVPDDRPRPTAVCYGVLSRRPQLPGPGRPRPGSATGDALRLGPATSTATARPAPTGLQRLTNFNRPSYSTCRTFPVMPPRPGAQHLRLARGRGLAGADHAELLAALTALRRRARRQSQHGAARTCVVTDLQDVEHDTRPVDQRLAVLLDVHGPADQRRPTAPRSTATSSSSRTGRSARCDHRPGGEQHRLPGRRRDRVEGVFGYSKNVVDPPPATPPATGPAPTGRVLLRWDATSSPTRSSRSATGSPT